MKATFIRHMELISANAPLIGISRHTMQLLCLAEQIKFCDHVEVAISQVWKCVFIDTFVELCQINSQSQRAVTRDWARGEELFSGNKLSASWQALLRICRYGGSAEMPLEYTEYVAFS